MAENAIVSGNYFEVAGIPLIAGRLFDNRDTGNAPRTILVNVTFALRFFKNPQDAIGNRINNGTSTATIADSIGDRRLNAWLVGSFALVALFLAALGLYGIVSYGVIQRYSEIAVRMALGAGRAQVIRLIMWDGARMILTGTLIGILCSLGLTRLLQRLLYEVAPYDPTTLAGVVLLLSGVAFVASYLPARRAATIDPVRSLSE